MILFYGTPKGFRDPILKHETLCMGGKADGSFHLWDPKYSGGILKKGACDGR
jgi:hypothetical protein